MRVRAVRISRLILVEPVETEGSRLRLSRPRSFRERVLDRLVQGPLAPHRPGALELRRRQGVDAFSALCSVAQPTAERRGGHLVLDRAPETAGALALSSRSRDAGEETDA